MQEEKYSIRKFLGGYVKKSLEVFKHPLRLLPTLVLGIVWIVIGYLSSVISLPLPLKVVSFLSFAEGGLFGGVFGAVGGIVGKVIVAAFVNAAVLPLFDKKMPFSGFFSGFKGMAKSISLGSIKGVAPLICGLGLSLLLYSFMNITQSGQNSVVGLVSIVLLVQGIASQGGFMWGLLFCAAGKISGGRTPSFVSVTRMIAGMSMGFTIAVGLSVIGLPFCFILGFPITLFGLLLLLLARMMK